MTWKGVVLPQADGLPFGTDLHPPGALMTGYQARGAQLDVFAGDRDGMLRIYLTPGGRAWEADVVPEAVGIPPGACIATGYQSGGSVLDVFVVGRSGEPLIFQGTDDGRWYSRRVPLETPLPHGANLSTGYQIDTTHHLTAFSLQAFSPPSLSMTFASATALTVEAKGASIATGKNKVQLTLPSGCTSVPDAATAQNETESGKNTVTYVLTGCSGKAISAALVSNAGAAFDPPVAATGTAP